MNNSVEARLKTLRKQKGLSQKEAAEYLGITNSSISLYERGINQPSLEILARLAVLYNTTTDYILGITHPDNTVYVLKGLSKEQEDVIMDVVQRILQYPNTYESED